jgi:hypothetical protein
MWWRLTSASSRSLVCNGELIHTVDAQKEVANKINARLVEANILPVGEDKVAWKMHILVRDGLAKGKNEKGNCGEHTR